MEADPLNHPAIPAANAGHQCTSEHPANLADLSESAGQSTRQIKRCAHKSYYVEFHPKQTHNCPSLPAR